MRLHRVVIEDSDSTMGRGLSLVYGFADHDLKEIITEHHKKMGPLRPSMIKSIMYQILSGLHHLHSNWVMHRDLKPCNILIVGGGNPEAGRVKIADFGLARVFQAPLRKLADDGEVVTRWYRAPELLLAANHYTPAIDVWSAGCIMGELFLRKPLFPGNDKEDKVKPYFYENQMRVVTNVLGSVDTQRWPEAKQCPLYDRIRTWSATQPNVLAQTLKLQETSLAHKLLSALLRYNPSERFTCCQAMQHEFFREEPRPDDDVFGGDDRYPRKSLRNLRPSPVPSGRRGAPRSSSGKKKKSSIYVHGRGAEKRKVGSRGDMKRKTKRAKA